MYTLGIVTRVLTIGEHVWGGKQYTICLTNISLKYILRAGF